MQGTVYLNGDYLPAQEAMLPIFDRATLFGDAVYDVAGVLDGKLIDFDSHYKRLQRSLGALSIPNPLDRDRLLGAFRKLVQENSLEEGMVYVQVTRGTADRDFAYADGMTPNVFMFTQVKDESEYAVVENGVALKSVPDIRWARRDIKSVNLLGQVLVKQAAKDEGYYEALMLDNDGYITECGATSFFYYQDGVIVTRALSPIILPGVTRQALIALCEDRDIKLEQRLFTLGDVFSADEAFITGASTYVLPVVRVDDAQVGNGEPGEFTRSLRQVYLDFARKTSI